MAMKMSRRCFTNAALLGGASLGLNHVGSYPLAADDATSRPAAVDPMFSISLGEYSLHRRIAKGELDHLDFAAYTKSEFGIDAVEYWTGPFQKKANDKQYLRQLKLRSDDVGVTNLLILVDGEGHLGNPDEKARVAAVENHYKWVEAAKLLGCHSIRVNALSKGDYDDQLKLVADGLSRLSEFGSEHKINVIVENHGGLSSNGRWLAAVMKAVAQPNCGTLPDFGNFHNYDRYKGCRELMPFAKAVSAKSHEFDEDGNETRTDYRRIMKIVLDAGYRGYVGIEYEGSKHSEIEGIRLTQRLLEKVRAELVANGG